MTRRGWRRTWPYAGLAAITYLPLLFTRPGQISADTKSYLYLDPGDLVLSATGMWDPDIALGYVPHQNIGYLWPLGPWFWTFDALGVPDWLAQRLWWGTLLFTAGAGVLTLGRRLGWRVEAAAAAALAYALTPYTVVFVARISGILVAWAVLPWLVLLAHLSVRSRGWRHPALFAVAATSAGSTNLTALLLVGIGAVLWLVHLAVVAREEPVREVLKAAGRIGLLTTGTCAWWLGGLLVQAGYGTDILRYSETAEAVTGSSTANEVLRGLGNWFFYGADRLGPWIEPSVTYTQRVAVLAVTFGIPFLGLLLAAWMRWRHRAFAVALVVTGLFLAVGAYPFDHPPPLGRAIRAVLLDDRGLALRALSRATPLLVLGLALLLGGAISAIAMRSAKAGRGLAAGVALLAVLGLPPLWQGTFVPENLRRPEEIPEYWREAAAHLDAGNGATRALEIPGSDFASYRWGNTVDPITPGIVDRSVAYRELIPFGPPPSAALLSAFDLGLQERTLPASAIGPIARLLRAGDLVVRSDLEFERFNTPRPKVLYDLVRRAGGLGEPVGFGPGLPNRPDPSASLDDEVWLLTDHLLPDPPEVAVVPVLDPVPLLTTHAPDRPLVVSGDAFGIVDLAAAGLIDGRELLRFSAGLDDRELAAAVDEGAVLVVTDTNRKRGQRWTTIRHTQGFTETEDGELLRRDLTDNRLPFFDEVGPDAKTVAVHEGGITATATSYGNAFAMAPEERPAAAVDGDRETAWRTAGFDDPTGERLRVELDEPITTGRLRLLQPTTREPDRWITEVAVRFDDGPAERVRLDASSRRGRGQVVELPVRTFRTVELEILADSSAEDPPVRGVSSVGFAEVELGPDGPVLDEWIRTPVDLVARAGTGASARPLAVVLTRLRQDATDYLSDDAERRLARIVTLPDARELTLSGTARISARAVNAPIEDALGRGGPVVVGAEARLLGSRRTGAAVLDGDPSTWWISPRNGPTGTAVRFSAAAPTSIEALDLQVVADGRFSTPTELEVSADGGSPVTVALPPVAPRDRPGAVVAVRAELPEPVAGRHFVVRFTGAAVERVIDWNSAEPVAQPIAVAELGVPGVSVPPLPRDYDSGCRGDLLTVDGAAVPVRITGTTEDALAGRPLRVEGCGPPLALGPGPHRIRSAVGAEVGIDLDQLVLRSHPSPVPGSDLLVEAGAPPAQARVLEAGATSIEAELNGAPGEQVWLVLGESFNDGWAASVDGARVAGPDLVDGFANGWRVTLGADGTALVDLEFEPQRGIRAGILLSLATFAACAALVVVGRPAPQRVVPGPVLRRRHRSRDPQDRPPLRHAATITGLTGAGAALVAPWPLALALAAVAALGCRHRSVAVAIRFAPAALALAVAVIVIQEQVASDARPGFAWATAHDTAHLVTIAAVLLLVIDLAVSRWWDR